MDIDFNQSQQGVSNTLKTNITAPPKVITDLSDRNSDIFRLASFNQYHGNNGSSINRGLLARYGFMYDRQDKQVKCHACKSPINPTVPNFNPRTEHLKLNSQCPFVLSHPELFSTQHEEQPTNHQTSIGLNIQLPTGYDAPVTDGITSVQQTKFFSIRSTKLIRDLRLATFLNWPMITPSASTMAEAGFYYTNIADRVICLECHIMFHKWTDQDQPLQLHALISPSCPFIKAGQTNGNAPIGNELKLLTAPETQVVTNPSHSEYAEITRRLNSFTTWPQKEEKTLPAPTLFANAGFFYTGHDTIVRCFYCNGALKNWQPNDDPKIEHARWFPHCSYIRQYIGENLYDAIQRKNRQLSAQQNLPPDSANGWSDVDRDRMVKARLDLPEIIELRNQGYNLAILRKAIDMQLKTRKDDFKSIDELCIAYFILEQQVKVINGNEAHVLVPADWLKLYHENPEGALVKPSVMPPKAPNTLPSPKASSSGNTQASEQSDDSAKLCLICLDIERQVACMPCGHLTTCVACGHSLRSCPICRSPVKGLCRIYL